MSKKQRDTLWRLIREYAGNMKPAVEHRELMRIRDAGVDAVFFAWAGSETKGERFYYRIQGPTFVIELRSPSGTTVGLHNRTTTGILGNYPGTLVVEGPGDLSAFVGESAVGNWDLILHDWLRCDSGVLNSWTIHLSCL